MKQLKYVELIAQTEESQAEANRELLVETAELELKGHILALKKLKLEAVKKVENAKRAIPFNTRAVYTAQTEADKLDREIKYVQKIQKELF